VTVPSEGEVVSGVVGGCETGGKRTPLSTAQREVKGLIEEEHLTVRQIAHRRGTSEQAVRKIIQKLREAEGGEGGLRGVAENGDRGTTSETWELHGCAWRCVIHYGKNGEKYQRAVGGGVARVRVRDATVELHRDVVEVHADPVFRASHPEGAVALSWAYLWRILALVENDYRVILRKDRCAVRRFRGHFPHLDDALAREPAGAEIRVLADDGRLRFLIDWSKRTFPEAEWLHASLGEDDARRYAGFLHDLVERESLPLSELSQEVVKLHKAVAFLAEAQGRTEQALGVTASQQAIGAANLNILLDVLKPRPAEPEGLASPKDKRLDDYFG
jgi:hypothetical protein